MDLNNFVNQVVAELTPQLDQLIKVRLEAGINAINKRLSELPKDFIPSLLRSPEQNELAAALAKAQGEFDFARLNKQNSHFKTRYADLCSILKVALPVLSKHGLSLMQEEITNYDEQTYVITTLSHCSGQFRQSKARLTLTKAGHQEYGSAMTYLKRRTISAILGIVGADDDDDAETAEAEYRDARERGVGINLDEELRDKGYVRVNKQELDELNYELDGHSDIAKRILKNFGISTLADLPKEKYRIVIDRVREHKNLRENK